MAAGIGGADCVTALPFSQANGLPDGFARRMARNCQLILQEESGIGRQADAAAGSGYVEALTDEIGSAAWAQFQNIEAQGGMIAVLASGYLDSQLADTRQQRSMLIGERRMGLTGVTEFPNLSDEAPRLLEVALPDDWMPPERSEKPESRLSCGPLKQQRDAEPFEVLRARADKHAAEKGKRASVFLANLGTPADYTARATWTRNLFAVGGIATTDGGGFSDAKDAAKAFEASGLDIACISSSDSVYEELAVETAAALKAAGADYVYLAGDPPALRETLGDAGVDEFLKQGICIRRLLQGLQALLGMVDAGERV